MTNEQDTRRAEFFARIGQQTTRGRRGVDEAIRLPSLERLLEIDKQADPGPGLRQGELFGDEGTSSSIVAADAADDKQGHPLCRPLKGPFRA